MRTEPEYSGIIIRLTEFGLLKKNQFFTLQELFEKIEASQEERNFIKSRLVTFKGSMETQSDLIGYVSSPEGIANDNFDNHIYSLLPNAIYSYHDFLELKEARERAESASQQSVLAIRLAIYAIIISIIIGIGELMMNFISIIFKD